MGSMPSLESLIVNRVEYLIVIVKEIPSINIIYESVGVVIDAVARYFTGVDPGVGRQIRMRKLDAGVSNGNDNIVDAGSNIPRLWRLDVCSRLAARRLIPRIQHAPL